MKPFLQGKKSLNVPSLRAPVGLKNVLARPTAASSAGGSESSEMGGAKIEIVKEGDKVARLIVTCACGEKIEIDCIYSAGT